jgi:hypothetical protein
MKSLNEIIKKHLHSLKEGSDGMGENYMFFSNLKQIHRQCEMLLNMDERLLDKIIQDGHDWADDHVSEAKTNMDQVFDFFMNKTKSEDGVEMNADMDSFSVNEEGQLNEKCWDGYKQVGSKMKNGKKVPNCVPVKGETNESYREIDESKNKPTNPKLWAQSLAWARSKYDVCPSAYCNGAAAKRYKSKGGGWRKEK